MHEQLQYTFTTPRTKALAFHPYKPVILSAHHTSVILSHDLHLNQHTYTFKAHDGPVRAIMFHPRTEIFASGGDDAKVILWSFSNKKQLHTFVGHTDYIRSIDFHPTNPWILSSSDDQTIRIWNFQSYKCIATISGHSHYVMSSRFVNNAIVSVSLDQSIRLWDYSSLLKKNEKSIIGVPSVFVKQIIEGHDRGINWIEKHPTKNIIATGGDDRQVKIWEVDEVMMERESYYSHSGNVTGITFIDDYVLSTGEDGILSIEGKKESKKIMDDTRMWCVSKNSDSSLFAIGYDSGIRIYSTKRKGIAYKVVKQHDLLKNELTKNCVYYCLNDIVYKNDLENEIQICKPRKECLSISVYEKKILVQYGSSWEVFEEKKSVEKGHGLCIFVGGKLVNLEKNVIFVNGKEVYESDEPIVSIKERDVSIGNGSVKEGLKSEKPIFYICNNSCVQIFDISKNAILHTIKIKEIEKIVHGDNLITLMTKRKIYILNYNYNILHTFEEMVEINDAFFDGNTLFYSTMRHIKYILNDCKGVLRSIEKEVYLLFRNNDYFFYMTKEGIENVSIDLSEYEFRKAVNENNKNEIERIIQEKKLCGTAIFEYLAKKGKGESILAYVDVERRIEILIESGKYEEAYNTIESNKDDTCKIEQRLTNPYTFYDKLFNKCMKDKVLDVAENCLLKMNDYNKLFIFYICTKQNDKIERLKKYGNEDFKLSVGIFLNDKEYLKSIIYSKGAFQMEDMNEGNIEENDDAKESYDEENVKKSADNDAKEKHDEDVIRVVGDDSDAKGSDEDNVDYTGEDEKKDDVKDQCAISEDRVYENNNDEEVYENKCIDESKSIDSEDDSNLANNIHNKQSIYNKKILDEKTKEIDDNFDVAINFEEAMNLVTLGKFKSAITLLKSILYFIVNKYDQNNNGLCFDDFSDEMVKEHDKHENFSFNQFIGFYLSGLILEKEKKKIDDKRTLLNISYYFSNLPLLENHKILAKTNFMIICYKNGRYEDAKKIGKEIESKVDANVKKMIGKILKCNKMDEDDTCNFVGDFCFDSIDFGKESMVCGVCRVRSKSGKICSCCEIGCLLQ